MKGKSTRRSAKKNPNLYSSDALNTSPLAVTETIQKLLNRKQVKTKQRLTKKRITALPSQEALSAKAWSDVLRLLKQLRNRSIPQSKLNGRISVI